MSFSDGPPLRAVFYHERVATLVEINESSCTSYVFEFGLNPIGAFYSSSRMWAILTNNGI